MSFLPTPEDIKLLRKKAGLTQRELAKRACVSQSLIARIEAGTVDPRLSTLRRILKVLEESIAEGTRAGDVMNSPVVYVQPEDSVEKAIKLMWKHGFSQLPVIKNDRVIGTIKEDDVLRALIREGDTILKEPVEKIMSDALPIVSINERIDVVVKILSQGVPAVLVADRGKIVGIITKTDIIAKKVRLLLHRLHEERKETYTHVPK